MNILEAAKHYADQGLAVFPVHGIKDGRCTCGKQDCSSQGKHPIHMGGLKNATTVIETIEAWWRGHPWANVAIATGDASGVFVLDTDYGPGKDGFASLEALENEFGAIRSSARVRTGSGGLHNYMRMPDTPLKSTAGKLAPSIDIRADGGYVVAPPSMHISGEAYKWETDLDTIEYPPKWLLEKLSSLQGSAANTNAPLSGFMREGSRNTDLTSYAGFLRRKHGYDADQLYHQLMVTNAGSPSPLPEAEVRAIAKSVSGYAANGLASYDDIPLSRDLAAHLALTFRCAEAVGWLAYNGTTWEPDMNGSKAQECAKKFVERIYESARANSDPESDAAKRARQILGAGKLAKAIFLAASDDCLRTKWASYDAKPNLLNLRNGTLDLETGILRDHDPDDLITKIGNAKFDPDATCPLFDRLLEDILPEEHRDFALRLFGYALLGKPKEQVFVLCYGHGANGKSTLVNAVTYAIGDYALNAEPSTFIKQKNPGIRNDLARLKGARMVATSELSTGEILDAPLVKRITGGDPITARFLHKELFEFDPGFVMFMTTNALPVINGADGAMGRRIALIPFNTVIPGEKRDASLAEKLKGEAPGIMNRLLEGLESYNANGLAIPEDLKAEAARYVQSSDMISGFIEERCDLAPDGKARAKELHFAYRMWCGEDGLRPLSQPQFRVEMIKKTEIVPTRTKAGVVWPGIALRRSRH